MLNSVERTHEFPWVKTRATSERPRGWPEEEVHFVKFFRVTGFGRSPMLDLGHAPRLATRLHCHQHASTLSIQLIDVRHSKFRMPENILDKCQAVGPENAELVYHIKNCNECR